MTLDVIQGRDTDSLLAQEAFRAEWAALMAACPWSTTFQGPSFICAWYRTYRERFEPLLVLTRARDGRLAGMLALAVSKAGKGLVVAGTHHAEYHAWICRPEHGDSFPLAVMRKLHRRIPSAGLRFRYLPPGAPTAWANAPDARRRCLLKPHSRPLLRLGDGEEVRKSLAKSGNKSRLRRLQRIGPVECRRITDPVELEANFDEIIGFYDTRRLAVNGSAPFRNDPLKRPFHLEMMKEPGLLDVTLLKVADQIASIQLNIIGNRRELHLGLIAHNPFLARCSPGKLHILLLAKMLIEEGIEQVDLTAGGDIYKERFANAWDQVHALTVFPAHHARQKAAFVDAMADAAKKILTHYDITPAQAMSLAIKLKRLRPAYFPELVRDGSRALRPFRRELRVYQIDASKPVHLNGHGSLRRNALDDLLAYQPIDIAPSRHEFMRTALARIEEDQHVYTRVQNGRLQHCGWLAERPTEELAAKVLPGFALPADSALVLDFETFTDARRRGLGELSIKTMLRDAALARQIKQVFIAVPADCAPARNLVEKLGFTYERSVFQEPVLRTDPPTAAGSLPPVVILGGEANALSVARDLGLLGVKVFAVGEPDSCVRHSRHCRWIDVPANGGAEKAWADYLLGPAADHLKGAIVLSCSDAGLQVLIRHREALLARYRLDISDPSAQLSMLDKLTTYKNARAAGVPVPLFWEISTRDEVLSIREQLVYPLLVKPRLSHIFEARFGRKHLTVGNFDELLAAFDACSGAGTDMLLMELIPGGDDHLCSYYTYIDERGKPRFNFTKRIIRRFPAGMGTACYHITDWVPEIVGPSQRLCHYVAMRGLVNIEFKRDDRDGQYKLIECNARFTASNCLVSASGFSLARFVYNRLAGRPHEKLENYRRGLRLWDPIRDFWAYRELSKRGEITFFQWLRSILHLQTYAFFRWTDPMPAVARALKPLRKLLQKK